MEKASYPAVPGYVAGSSTSAMAATSVKETAAALRERIYRLLAERGPLTDWEIMVALGRSEGSGSRPRRVELVLAGRVTGTAERRKNPSGRTAVVWAAVPE